MTLNPDMRGKLGQAPSNGKGAKTTVSGNHGAWAKQVLNNTKQAKVHSKNGK